jgi:Icc-related predicted phosphoesterase
MWIWAYHSPPDKSPTSWSGKRHFGDELLNDLAKLHQPDIVLTGHVHEAPFRDDGSWHDRIGDTLVLNAGRQTGPVPAHLVVDTTARQVTWSSLAGRDDLSF